MWTFRPGYLGVSIAVIALLGGVLLGSLLNVSSHDVQTTKYDYVSDISGLFDVSDEPQYIDYNPATNYTGYTNTRALSPTNPSPSGIEFQESATANNYRIRTTNYEQTAGPSGTVNNSSTYPQVNVNGDSGIQARGYITNASEIVGSADFAQLFDVKITSMYDWATAVFGNISQYSTINVNFTYPSITAPTTRAYIGSLSPYESPYGTYNLILPSYYTSITINATDQTFTVTGGGSGTYSLYDRYMIYGDASQQELYRLDNGNYGLESHDTTLSLTFTSTTALKNEYTYMVPSSGVYASSVGTVWDNDTDTVDYDNQRIQILFGPRFNNGSWVLPSPGTGGGVSVSVDMQSIGTFRPIISYNSVDKWTIEPDGSLSSRTTIGDFRGVMLDLVKTASGLNWAVYGITSFSDYFNVVISTVPSLSGSYSGNIELDKLFFSSISSKLAWSVYNTVVFMDTYGAVLADPSIDLADYWPDMDSYRFAFQSFALYGDSITINGVTYPVSNESIVINDRAYKLDNFYLSFSEQGDTSITFNNVNRTIDLGPTVDKVVSFAGNWGFTTGLYEGSIDVKKAYDWNIKLLGDNLNTIILIALGLVAVLMLACKWLGMSFKMTDKVVLGGSALFLVLLLVV